MNWYKEIANLLDREFGEQFVRGGCNPYLEYTSASGTISIRFRKGTYMNKSYFVCNYVSSSGKHKNVLNRIRKAIKAYGGFSGIIYEDVISTKAYDKVKDFECIDNETQTKEDLREGVQKYFDKYYGTFIENF